MRNNTIEETKRAMGDNESKEVEIRSFESDKNATFKLADNLHSTVLPKIRIPIRDLFL